MIGNVVLIWIIIAVAYFIINTIIAISWLVEFDIDCNMSKAQEIAFTLINIVLGLPIMTVVMLIALIYGLISAMNQLND